MKLIQLKLMSGITTYVNVDHIIRLYETTSNRTQVILTNGATLDVELPITVIINRIEND